MLNWITRPVGAASGAGNAAGRAAPKAGPTLPPAWLARPGPTWKGARREQVPQSNRRGLEPVQRWAAGQKPLPPWPCPRARGRRPKQDGEGQEEGVQGQEEEDPSWSRLGGAGRGLLRMASCHRASEGPCSGAGTLTPAPPPRPLLSPAHNLNPDCKTRRPQRL